MQLSGQEPRRQGEGQHHWPVRLDQPAHGAEGLEAGGPGGRAQSKPLFGLCVPALHDQTSLGL